MAQPFPFDGERFTDYSIGPRLGEHSAELLSGLGYSEEDIRSLVEKRVLITD